MVQQKWLSSHNIRFLAPPPSCPRRQLPFLCDKRWNSNIFIRFKADKIIRKKPSVFSCIENEPNEKQDCMLRYEKSKKVYFSGICRCGEVQA